MAKKQPEQKQKAPGASSKMNAQLFVMPKEYRHGKDVAVVEPKKQSKQVVQAPPVAPKPRPTPPKKPLPKKSGISKPLLIAGAIVLIAILVGGYLVLRSFQKQDVPETPITQPTPAPREAPEPEEPEVPEEPIEEPIEPEEPFVKIIVPGKDLDSDGLSDIEEQLVYGTNANLPDTDADGFLDGNEVFHRYNPGGTAPGTLLESGLASLREESTYSLLYPALWTVGASADGLLFVSTTGEQVRVSEKTVVEGDTTTVDAWKADIEKEVLPSKSKTGFDLLVSIDNLDAFLTVNGKALIFEYDPGVKSTVDYLQTFQMMINSVVLKEL